MKNSRRDFFKKAGLAGIGLAGSGLTRANSINETGATPSLIQQGNTGGLVPLNRFPGMVHEYFVDRVRKVEQEGIKRRAALKTKADAEAYIADVRNKIKQVFGPWPEKTPLNARITGILKRKNYNIEKIIFESRPGFLVTGNLYIPKGKRNPLPAVIGVCGHTNNGKAGYQNFSLGLVQKGYVVFTIDPIGQGERLQYVSSDMKPLHGVGVREHIYAGTQMFLTGESLYSWFAWDGIRAVDYLLTRKEVDPKHIGVTGNSGGGTQTTWLCATEPRITMAAPSCFVVTFRRNLENEEVADTEQCPWKALALGLDHADFIAAMAPKPVILMGQEKDFFDARGVEEAYGRLKTLYKLLGAEDNIQIFVGPDYHGYSQHNREAMYGFFNKVTGISNDNKEATLVMEKEEELLCTPKGQVADLKSKNVFSFTRQLALNQRESRGRLQGDKLKKIVKSAIVLPSWEGVPDFRILRPTRSRQYPKKNATTYVVETEPGIFAVVYRLDDAVLTARPPKENKPAILYISDFSADNELREEKFLSELINSEKDKTFYTCDVRGTGESQPGTTSKTFTEEYGSDYFYTTHSNLFDRPYAGQKTYDILKVINFLKSYGHNEIHLVAKGRGTLPATFAALFSENVKRITLKNALTSYADLAENEEYSLPVSSLIPGVVSQFDLPDCYNELKSKNLQIIT